MEEQEKRKPEDLSAIEEESAQEGQAEESPAKSSAGGYFKAAALCVILGGLSISSAGGFISFGEEGIGIFLFFCAFLLTLVGLVRALGIDD